MTTESDFSRQIQSQVGTYIIRPYRDSDMLSVLESWQAAFGQSLLAELWRWKYHKAPLGHKVMICLHSSGQVAALYGGIPFAAAWRGRDLRLCQLMDVFSHPAHRRALSSRGGLYVETALTYIEYYIKSNRLNLLYGLPSARPLRLGQLRMGYQKLAGGFVYLSVSTGKTNKFDSFSLRGQINEVLEHEFCGLDSLAAQSPLDRLEVRRDATFLSWRFFGHPQHRYRLFCYRFRFDLAWRGYAAVLPEHSSAVIVDLVLPRSKRHGRNFLHRLAKQLYEDGINRLHIWLPGNGVDAKRLQQSGFEPSPEPLGVFPSYVRPFDPSLPSSDIQNALHYTMADSDLF